MNTSQLECFLTVADTLSFAMAARELNLTQPAVSQQIKNLEDELGARLFNRTTRNVTLTQEGMLFIEDAKDILKTCERAKKKLSHEPEAERVRFVIGTHTYGEVSRVSPVLKELRIQFPELYPEFRVVPFQHLFRLLYDNETDVIISFKESQQSQGSNRYMEFAQIPITVILPEADPFAKKENISADDLSQRKLILVDPQKCPYELSQVSYRVSRDRSASDVYFTESVESALTLARAGFGAAVFPDISAWNEPSMKSIPLADTAPLSYGAYYKSAKGNPVLKRFLELSRQLWGE